MGKRAYNGQIHVRVSPAVHEDIAKEAFENGTSISGVLAQALAVRRALKNIDPWKSIQEVQRANKAVDSKEVDIAVKEAIKSVRKQNRG